jgi:hypothetical protein
VERRGEGGGGSGEDGDIKEVMGNRLRERQEQGEWRHWPGEKWETLE